MINHMKDLFEKCLKFTESISLTIEGNLITDETDMMDVILQRQLFKT